MDIKIAIGKQPGDIMPQPMKDMPKEKGGNSMLDNEWKLECIETLNEVLDKLKTADGKEAMDAVNNIEMAIKALDPQNDSSAKLAEEDSSEGSEESVKGMQDNKDNQDYMDKFQD